MSFNIKISNGKGNVTNLKVTKNDTISQAKSAAGYTPTKQKVQQDIHQLMLGNGKVMDVF